MKGTYAVSIFLGLVLSISVYAPQAEGVTSCSGKQVYPSQSLPSVAANNPPGTTFCVRDGTYNLSRAVVVESGDKFIGVFSDGTRPSIKTTTVHNIFDAKESVGATIRDLDISGAVGNNQCEPNCGRAIGGGQDLTVNNVRAHHNANQGIGGTKPGLLVTNSEIDHNGSYSFALDGGPRSAAGIKSVNSMTVLNSRVHDNYWSGVWCDNLCGAFQVKGSTLTKNGKAGIHYEASAGPAVFANNKIQANGGNNAIPASGRRAGLIIYASSNADVYGNTFGSNTFYGIEVAEDNRDWSPKLSKISLHDNTMNGDTIIGCALLPVICTNN
jgi:hypothetical protein